MRIWLSQHVRTLFATLGKLARMPIASLLNIGVIGVALALPAGLYVGLINLQRLSRELPAAPEISLFLSLDATPADVAQIEGRLRQQPAVLKFRYVPRGEALQELKTRAGVGDIVASLGKNPLPDAFVIDVRDRTARTLEQLHDELARWPKVEHVQLDAAWARRLEAVLRLGKLAVLLLTALLAFALVAVTFNTIRLQILTQREEIEVAQLIGATAPFIRRPFLYHGAVQGLAGGLAAWAIIWAGLHLLNSGLAEISQLYGTPLELRHLAPRDSLALFLFAAGLGWLGAWLSVSRHLSAPGRS